MRGKCGKYNNYVIIINIFNCVLFLHYVDVKKQVKKFFFFLVLEKRSFFS